MRRFLLFPLLISLWLVSAQFGLTVVGYLGSYLSVSIMSRVTDVYYHTPVISTTDFLPATVLGLVLGVLFAAADLAFHRQTRAAREATLRLTRNLLKSGVAVVILILLCQGAFLLFINQLAHSRYHAYPPDMIWMNRISLIQPFLIFAALLWALQRTFKGS